MRFAKVSAEVEARWANLRRGQGSLTEQEAHSIAASVHDAWLARHYQNPRGPTGWRADLYDQLWTETPPWNMDRPLEDRIRDLAGDLVSPARSQEQWCLGQAGQCLADLGRVVDEASRLRLARAVADAMQRASVALNRAAHGDYSGLKGYGLGDAATSLTPSAPVNRREKSETLGGHLTVTGLFEAWWLEVKAAGRKPSTRANYSNTIRIFVSFLKHDDARRVNPEDVVAFKNHRLSNPSESSKKVPSAKTVKDTDLAALKTVFGWAVANHKLMSNPASGVTVKVGKTQKLRSKGFTDVEAKLVLAAALAYVPSKERACTAAAKRWVPWLCAFTGARVGEIGQLRKQDVRFEGDCWVIRITPEAGTVKTDEAREVVLHPQLVELGFVEFATKSAEGPLFISPGTTGDVLGPLQGLKNRLAEFSRNLVPDPNVAPNHGWRHRFKTVGMEAGIETRILNAVQGHTGQTVSDEYGDVTLRTQAGAIRKLPWISLSPGVASST